jgi:hypothetical protein
LVSFLGNGLDPRRYLIRWRVDRDVGFRAKVEDLDEPVSGPAGPADEERACLEPADAEVAFIRIYCA